MDCYFHSNVPSVAFCTACRKSICATCRDEQGECPSCRLSERLDAASGRRLPGDVRAGSQARVDPVRPGPLTAVPNETRALVALGYPLWPLAVVALFDPKRDRYVTRQAWQSLGFNFGMGALFLILDAIASIPYLGWSARPLLPFLLPILIVADVIFAFKAWNGEDFRIPIVTDWIDARLPN